MLGDCASCSATHFQLLSDDWVGHSSSSSGSLPANDVLLAKTLSHFSATCRQEIVQVLPSNSVQDMDSNVERTLQWVRQYGMT